MNKCLYIPVLHAMTHVPRCFISSLAQKIISAASYLHSGLEYYFVPCSPSPP